MGARGAPALHEVNSPLFRRYCSDCETRFLFQSLIQEGTVPSHVVGCPKCGKRWRERQYALDTGRLLTIQEEVGDDVQLTTRSWLDDDR